MVLQLSRFFKSSILYFGDPIAFISNLSFNRFNLMTQLAQRLLFFVQTVLGVLLEILNVDLVQLDESLLLILHLLELSLQLGYRRLMV
jgi:hypothetical protein